MNFASRQFRLAAACAGVNLVLIVGGWMALVSPQRSDAANTSAQAQLVQGRLDVLLGKGSSHGPIKQPAIHTSGLYSLDTALPSQANMPDLLFELGALAKASGVTVVGISPQPAQANASGYTVLPINLQLKGTYYTLTGFLRRLRTLVAEQQGHPGHLIANGPLFRVDSVAYTQGSKGHELLATIGASTFFYGVTAGATPPASATDTSTTTTTGG